MKLAAKLGVIITFGFGLLLAQIQQIPSPTHASTELSDTAGIVRGAAGLTTTNAIPKGSGTPGSLTDSAIRDNGTAVTMAGRTLGSDPGGAVPAWSNYIATLHPSTWTTCTSANPIICTMTAHSLPTGASTVWVAGGAGDWAALNGTQTVTWTSTTAYSIAVDGSTWSAFGAQAITARSWGVTGYQDVASAAALTQDLPILALPENWQVMDWAIKPTTRCTGPTTIKTGLGNTLLNTRFRTNTIDLDVAVADTNIYSGPTNGSGTNTAAATAMVLSLISTGTNINTVSACAIKVSVLWGVRP